jgi:8-oxo-dGTP pyrophosphatase MutT (NUDIX family)
MQRFAELIKIELEKGLPGKEVQWQMASSDRMKKKFPLSPGDDAQVAAVLILLYPYKESVFTVFMQRHAYKGVHGGQISFPGGKKEKADHNIIQTAIREAHEETGVDPSKIDIIGSLTPLFIPVSNIIVTPVLGWINSKPVFNHQVEEVVFLFEADLKTLINPVTIKTKPLHIGGELIEVKYFDYDGYVIWGATAMILNEFLTILRRGKIIIQ